MTKIIQSSAIGSKVDFDELTTAAQRQLVPVGTVFAWLKSYTNTPSLPDGWAECDGSAVSDTDSPYNGQNLPDLNSGTQRFLRGSTTSGTTGGSDAHTHTVTPATHAPLMGGGPARNTGENSQVTTGGASALPNYYEVVWIIKIK